MRNVYMERIFRNNYIKMIELDHITGYRIEETIEDSPLLLLRGRRESDQQTVLIKSALLSNENAVKKLQHEFELLSFLNSESTLKPVSLERLDGQLVLI